MFSALGLFILSSYEATFTLVSRASLERLRENGIERAGAMLRIYEPRRRLHVMARVGQGLGALSLGLSVLVLLRPIVSSAPAAMALTILISLGVFIATSLPRRVRFEEEGEEPRIPALTLTYLPLHAALSPFARLLEHITTSDYSDEVFKAEKEEELRSLVDSERETGVLEEGERDMIHGVFGFHDRVVREVMVPRVDITAVEQSDSIADLLGAIRDTGHSRVPVFEESLDHIRGVVYAKDLLQFIDRERDVDLASPLSSLIAPSGEDSAKVARDAYFVPETRKIDELLRDLRTARTRLAIVVDEYGGTAGLVTTEDLIEEIVGEIRDEYDEAEEDLYHWEAAGEKLVVNPKINIDDLNEVLDVDLSSDGFDTLGGFIYDHLGRVPETGQKLDMPGLEIEILVVEGQRISRVSMTKKLVINGETGDRDRTGRDA